MRTESYTQAWDTEKCQKVSYCVIKCNKILFVCQNRTGEPCGYGVYSEMARGAERLC